MILCGTGHRPDKLGGYSEKVYERLVKLAHTWLYKNLPADQEHEVISGMALGWDQALAEAALHLDEYRVTGGDCRVRLLAAVPFLGQELAWPAESQRKYHKLLSQADKIVRVCEPGYAAWKMQTRNAWMCDHSEKVLALWNQSSGGTANCVGYAMQKGREIINLWPEWMKLNAEEE